MRLQARRGWEGHPAGLAGLARLMNHGMGNEGGQESLYTTMDPFGMDTVLYRDFGGLAALILCWIVEMLSSDPSTLMN